MGSAACCWGLCTALWRASSGDMYARDRGEASCLLALTSQAHCDSNTMLAVNRLSESLDHPFPDFSISRSTRCML